jgi:hypothetical protein
MDQKNSLRVKLEDDIEAIYSIKTDLELLYKTHGDRKTPMDENEVANNLLGLICKVDMLFYWLVDSYERYFELNDYASSEVKARREKMLRKIFKEQK